MNLKNTVFMVFDVESIGLHGEGFSVGYVVMEDGREVESAYYRCNPNLASGLAEPRKWVEENVVPVMEHPVRCRFSDGIGSKSPREVREAFWDRWSSWKGNGAILAADCLWPVEANFLAQCVRDDPTRREWGGPYPFIDVASVRLATGSDPLADEKREDDELPKHHPLADARQSARLLLESLET
jgi:hypothetical protein